MNREHFEKDAELFAKVDVLAEWIRANAPQTQMLNIPRYREVVRAKARLDRLLEGMGEGATSLELNPLFGAATLRVELEDLEVGSISDFTEAVQAANNFEIYPLKNGKMRLTVTFYRVMQKI